MKKVTIDKEFSGLITGDQNSDLEDTILADGRFIDPLVLWRHKNTLLDGHRRWKIHVKHPSLKMPAPVILDFESRQEAHDWIIHHQLSKRNATDEQRKYLIGKLYLTHKPRQGKPGKLPGLQTLKKAAEIAKSEGVYESTVRRNAKFAEAVDAVREVSTEVAAGVLSGEIKGTTKALETLAGGTKRDIKKAEKAISDGKAKSVSTAIRISGGTSFDPVELEAAVNGRKPRRKSGRPITSGKDRALATKCLSELCRIFKRLEIFDEFNGDLSRMIKRVKSLT